LSEPLTTCSAALAPLVASRIHAGHPMSSARCCCNLSTVVAENFGWYCNVCTSEHSWLKKSIFTTHGTSRNVFYYIFHEICSGHVINGTSRNVFYYICYKIRSGHVIDGTSRNVFYYHFFTKAVPVTSLLINCFRFVSKFSPQYQRFPHSNEPVKKGLGFRHKKS
jgi:hypothetical protein